jgi:hypothetical protein
MQRKLVSRMVAIVVCGLLVAASSARAEDKDKDTICSDRTIEGDYASAVDGVILPAPGVSLSIRGINMVHNDGKGHSTQVDSLILNGTPISDWTPVTGTYHINADCTGTGTLLPSTGGFVNLRFVVAKHGKEIHAVVWPPFDGPDRVVTSVAIKVE